MDQVFVNWGCRGEWGNKSQFRQSLSSARLTIRSQTDDPKSSGGLLCIRSINNGLDQRCMFISSFTLATSRDEDWECTVKSWQRNQDCECTNSCLNLQKTWCIR